VCGVRTIYLLFKAATLCFTARVLLLVIICNVFVYHRPVVFGLTTFCLHFSKLSFFSCIGTIAFLSILYKIPLILFLCVFLTD